MNEVLFATDSHGFSRIKQTHDPACYVRIVFGEHAVGAKRKEQRAEPSLARSAGYGSPRSSVTAAILRLLYSFPQVWILELGKPGKRTTSSKHSSKSWQILAQP